jgi:hypothetical protein
MNRIDLERMIQLNESTVLQPSARCALDVLTVAKSLPKEIQIHLGKFFARIHICRPSRIIAK